MSPSALPRPIRDQVFEVITRSLGRTPSPQTRLADLGSVEAVGVLIDLERCFHIGIDVDEILPDRTIDDLIELTEARAMEARVPAPASGPAKLFDLSAEREARARRAQAEPAVLSPTEVESAYRLAGAVAWLALAAALLIAATCYGVIAGRLS